MFQSQSYCSLIVTSFSERAKKTNLNREKTASDSQSFARLRPSSPDSGIVKEEIVDYDDSVEPAPTEYEKVKY